MRSGGQAMVYAHRGASSTHPENTLAAFAEAIRLGADGIELDVRATSDGVPVVSHDFGLRRAWGIERSIGDLTLADLRGLAPSVPTLAEALDLVGGRCRLDIEIKEAGVEASVLGLLAELERERWVISSFDWDVLREIRGLDETAELWVLCLAATGAAVEAADGLDATTLAIEQTAITPDVVRQLGARDRLVMAWTVNAPGRAADLGSMGVAAVCTDDPAAVIAAMRST